jgi:hypothetical protein
MKETLSILQGLIALFTIFTIFSTINLSINYYIFLIKKEYKTPNLNEFMIISFILSILIGVKYYLELLNL